MTMIFAPKDGAQVTPVHYVINDGNERVFYATLSKATPEGELRHGKPTWHDNGDMEFPEEPADDIYGYDRDSENRKLFHPQWLDCMERALGVFLHGDLPVVAARCNHYLAGHFTKPVTVEQCRECPARRANPRREPMPRTAAEFIARAEARSREAIKKRLGDDIFERAPEILKAWQEGRSPIPPANPATSKTANSSSHGDLPESSAT
jgi:hypothetical protein